MDQNYIDFNAVLKTLAGQTDLMNAAIDLSIEHLPQHFHRLQIAIESKDVAAIDAAAHCLRGSLSIYLYKPIIETARAIEMAGQKNDIPRTEILITELQTQLKEFIKELKSYRQRQNHQDPQVLL